MNKTTPNKNHFVKVFLNDLPNFLDWCYENNIDLELVGVGFDQETKKEFNAYFIDEVTAFKVKMRW